MLGKEILMENSFNSPLKFLSQAFHITAN